VKQFEQIFLPSYRKLVQAFKVHPCAQARISFETLLRPLWQTQQPPTEALILGTES
jgi:hypothetical protein